MSPFLELIALTKRHLIEEYPSNQILFTTEEMALYFKNSLKKAPPAAPKTHIPAPIPIKLVAQKKAAVAPIKVEPEVKEVKPHKAPTVPILDFADIKGILKEKLPALKIIEEIPEDSCAKKVASSWNHEWGEVVLIAPKTTPEGLLLLQNMAKAIQSLGYSARVLQEMPTQDKIDACMHLKLLVIGEDCTLTSKNSIRLLPLKNYIDQPQLKSALWKQLQVELKK